MAKYITLYEGECESSVIEWLKLRGYVFGKMIKQVLSEVKSINRALNMINRQTVVTVVMDCDTLLSGEANRDRLLSNIKWLLKNSKKTRIITQNKNLEDELIQGLGLKKHSDLYQHFDSNNKSTYKQTLASMIPEKLDSKFGNLNLEVFWQKKILNKFYKESDIIILNCTLKDIKQLK